jgi:P-type Cu2+ transporter
VLLNSGNAIERLAEVDRIIFDKTGTLTLPELDVVSASIPPEVFALAGRLALASHIIRSPRASNARSSLAAVVEEPGRAFAPSSMARR